MRFVITVLLSVLAAYGLGYYIAVPANPEIKLWKIVAERRKLEIAAVRDDQPGKPIIFFTGGSSCAFSIDPKIIEETCGLPAFNLGLPVSAGAQYLIHQALMLTSAGDILVICLEPDLLTALDSGGSPSKFSFAMAAAEGNISDAAGGETFEQSLKLPDYLNLPRPGPSHIATLTAKLLTNRGYRYKLEDLRYHGRMETQLTNSTLPAVGIAPATQLSQEGKALLTTALKAATHRNIKLLYSMPWHYTAAQNVDQNRLNKLKVMADIAKVIPVVDDGFAGAVSEYSYFSDTGLHLSGKGSAVRTQSLANALKNSHPLH